MNEPALQLLQSSSPWALRQAGEGRTRFSAGGSRRTPAGSPWRGQLRLAEVPRQPCSSRAERVGSKPGRKSAVPNKGHQTPCKGETGLGVGGVCWPLIWRALLHMHRVWTADVPRYSAGQGDERLILEEEEGLRENLMKTLNCGLQLKWAGGVSVGGRH